MEADTSRLRDLEPAEPPAPPISGPRSIVAVVLYLAGQLLGGALAMAPAILSGGVGAATDPSPMLVLVSAVAGILLGALLAFVYTLATLRPLPARRALASVGVRAVAPARMLGPLGAGMALSLLLLAAVVTIFPEPSESSLGPMAQLASSGGAVAVLLALVAIFVAPPIEEFLFRGVLLTGTAASWGRRVSWLLVTGLFVLLHLFEAFAFLPAMIPITIMALIAYRLRETTGSILPAVGLHAGYNLGLFGLLLVQVTLGIETAA